MMKYEGRTGNIPKSNNAKDTQRMSTVWQLLECRAMLNDRKINNRLLRELIFKYFVLEKKLKALNRELIFKQDLIEQDLAAAAKIQRSLLPNDFSSLNGLNVAWKFQPCQKIGGDIFNLIQIDSEHCAMYMIDVAGHGVPAAMIAVSVFQYLQPQRGNLMMTSDQNLENQKVKTPARILKFLDQEFTFDRFDSFFTMNYAIINAKTGKLTSSSAGHPPPIILRKDGSLKIMRKGGPAIGTFDLRSLKGGTVEFEEEYNQLFPGDKLILYTDGVSEYQNAKGKLYGNDRFLNHLMELKGQPIERLLESVYNSLIVFGNNAEPKDDVSLLGMELTKA
jgi:sigma-B regulation protein RsbU (phosphoserine phosphatase)